LNSIASSPSIVHFKVKPLYELFDVWSGDPSEREKRDALQTAFHMYLARKQPTVGCADEVGNWDISDAGLCAYPPPSPPPPLPYPPPPPPSPPPPKALCEVILYDDKNCDDTRRCSLKWSSGSTLAVDKDNSCNQGGKFHNDKWSSFLLKSGPARIQLYDDDRYRNLKYDHTLSDERCYNLGGLSIHDRASSGRFTCD
jgi:hypothetical protein